MQSQQLHAKWREFINNDEIQRLEELEGRIDRKKRSLAEATSERQTIMNRAIRRMRRANGKN